MVRNCVALANGFKAAGGTLVLVHVAFSASGADRLQQPVDEAMAVPPGGMPPNWSEFVAPVAALQADVVIAKRQWSAFHGTELDLQLRRRGITTIVLGGIATNFGVESTAREAWQHNYGLIVAEDACSTMGDGMHVFAMQKIMPRLGRVRTTAEILSAIGH